MVYQKRYVDIHNIHVYDNTHVRAQCTCVHVKGIATLGGMYVT